VVTDPLLKKCKRCRVTLTTFTGIVRVLVPFQYAGLDVYMTVILFDGFQEVSYLIKVHIKMPLADPSDEVFETETTDGFGEELAQDETGEDGDPVETYEEKVENHIVDKSVVSEEEED